MYAALVVAGIVYLWVGMVCANAAEFYISGEDGPATSLYLALIITLAWPIAVVGFIAYFLLRLLDETAGYIGSHIGEALAYLMDQIDQIS